MWICLCAFPEQSCCRPPCSGAGEAWGKKEVDLELVSEAVARRGDDAKGFGDGAGEVWKQYLQVLVFSLWKEDECSTFHIPLLWNHDSDYKVFSTLSGTMSSCNTS